MIYILENIFLFTLKENDRILSMAIIVKCKQNESSLASIGGRSVKSISDDSLQNKT